MASNNVTRGVRASIPPGIVVGRAQQAGTGAAQQLPIRDIALTLNSLGGGTGGGAGGHSALSSVSNVDGTLTISPTTGNIIASIALGHANTWTGQQTFVAPIIGAATGTSLTTSSFMEASLFGIGTNGSSLSGNGQAIVSTTSVNGLSLTGKGSTYDFLVSNSAASAVFGIPTGTVNVFFQGAITAGTWQGSLIGVTYGGTGANLSASGGTSNVVKQLTTGAAFTVAALANADLVVNSGGGTANFLRADGSWTAPVGTSGGVGSVSNSDGTLTITPTTGAVVASLALGHVNTWSAAQTFSGGVTVSTSFTATGLVTNAALAGSITAAKLVGTDIATVGTITSGTWNGTKIGLAYGGTNADLSATGGSHKFLAQASSGAAVTVAQPAQADITGLTTSDSPTHAGLTLSGLTAGSVLFAGTSGVISQSNAQLFWDNSNSRLGIGAVSPSDLLTITRNVSGNDAGGITLINLSTAGWGSSLTFQGTSGGNTYAFGSIHAENQSTGGQLIFNTADTSQASTSRMTINSAGTLAVSGAGDFTGVVRASHGFTVGTLPTGTTGQFAYVTDASAPTFHATVAAGGAVVTPVFYNGSNWICV